jgi:hypothetical protein
LKGGVLASGERGQKIRREVKNAAVRMDDLCFSMELLLSIKLQISNLEPHPSNLIIFFLLHCFMVVPVP